MLRIRSDEDARRLALGSIKPVTHHFGLPSTREGLRVLGDPQKYLQS